MQWDNSSGIGKFSQPCIPVQLLQTCVWVWNNLCCVAIIQKLTWLTCISRQAYFSFLHHPVFIFPSITLCVSLLHLETCVALNILLYTHIQWDFEAFLAHSYRIFCLKSDDYFRVDVLTELAHGYSSFSAVFHFRTKKKKKKITTYKLDVENKIPLQCKMWFSVKGVLRNMSIFSSHYESWSNLRWDTVSDFKDVSKKIHTSCCVLRCGWPDCIGALGFKDIELQSAA